ncbi:glucose 1-dehydrogenase [Alphaproteobacteria bacterium]|jgi:2-deoxy-D-gluconate 3-dehydrogenase|nr:glucose 1-dehydrogenase [Alphaproteobacteria bacterium]MDB9871881.1 glucose 1-dehydrogenase [Alphaproteobacteria bacterium]|tara:strand:+ start:619 stop:1383 length:765 start_codon:yes stop_codon:yes gene_type:complete
MELFNLSAKVALVTGGNGGIGFSMAKAIGKAGAKIIIAGRNDDKNNESIEELKSIDVDCISLNVDVTSESSCDEMIKKSMSHFGKLNILINNAGTNIRKRPEDYELDEWKSIIDTNLISMFICSKACFPHFKSVGGGKIINIGSMHSLFGAPLGSAYSASKGGVVQLTKSLANSWAKDNIQVNAVLPGYIDTKLTQQARVDIPELQKRVEERTPVGRWGNPDDLGGIAVFLSSDGSNFISGTAIPVDGGYSING